MSKPDTTITRCPSCGAPITMHGDQGTCSYCGTMVQRRAGEPDAPPIVTLRSVTIQVNGTSRKARKSNGGIGYLALILTGVALFVGFMMVVTGVVPYRQLASLVGAGYQGWPLFGSERISSLIRPVPNGAGVADLLVFLMKGRDGALGLVDGSGRILRWQLPMSKEWLRAAITVDQEAVYVADQANLRALRLSDGTPIWAVTLPVEADCDTCLVLVGDTLVMLQKDGTLRAFDSQTGQPLWDTRPEPAPNDISVFDGKLVLVKPVEGESNYAFHLIDPHSGKLAQRIEPICERETEKLKLSSSARTGMLLAPDGRSFFVLLEGNDKCVQRWNAGEDKPAWEAWVPYELAPSELNNHSALASEGYLFITRDGTFSALDTATGALKILAREEKMRFVPLFAGQGIVVVKATPDWDSNRHNLWALDLATGQRLWDYRVAAKKWFGDSGSNEWGAALAGTIVSVVQVPGDIRELSVERLDLRNGASLGRQVASVPGRGSTSVWGNRWNTQTAWLLVDNTLFTIDLSSGMIAAQTR